MTINNVYVILSNKGLYYVGRSYIDRFTCRDSLMSVFREYPNRRVCSNAITFNSKESAIEYCKNNNYDMQYFRIAKYNPCMNCIVD